MPWKICCNSETRELVITDGLCGHVIAHILTTISQRNAPIWNNQSATSSDIFAALANEREKQDARLMTTAPDLLASLQWIVAFCKNNPEWFKSGCLKDSAEMQWLKNAQSILSDATTEE